MKKKCTNSNCRKVFTITVDNNVECPFCGKKYPRIGLLNSKWESKNEKRIIEKIEKENKEGIIICGVKNTGFTCSSNMRMTIRKWTNLSSKESKEALENIPYFIDCKKILLKNQQQSFFSEERALKHSIASFAEELETVGVKCIIV